MQYDSSKQKIEKTFDREDKNSADIKDLKKIDIFASPENTTKRIVTLPLITGYNFAQGLGGTFSPFVEVIAGGNDEVES